MILSGYIRFFAIARWDDEDDDGGNGAFQLIAWNSSVPEVAPASSEREEDLVLLANEMLQRLNNLDEVRTIHKA